MFPLASIIAINDSSTIITSVSRSGRLLFGPVWRRSLSASRVSMLHQRCESRRPPDRLQPTRHVRARFPTASEEPGSAPRRHIGLTCGSKSGVIKSVLWQGEWGWKASTCQWLPVLLKWKRLRLARCGPLARYEQFCMAKCQNFRRLMEPRYSLDATLYYKPCLFILCENAPNWPLAPCPWKSASITSKEPFIWIKNRFQM